MRNVRVFDGRYVVFARGERSHHILIENNHWRQDPTGSMWRDILWLDSKRKRYFYYNGGIFGSLGNIFGDGSSPATVAALLRERFGVVEPSRLQVWGQQQWFAPMASGSNPGDAMIVCPCTMGALAAIAGGLSENLLERAADVMIKEGRKLVLVPREAPFSAIHLENMLKLARLGVVILPPNPGFYHHPQSVADLVDFVVARILDQLGVSHQLMARWGESQ